MAKKKPKPPGPAAETLSIGDDWKDAIKRAIGLKRPKGGWPKPKTGNRSKGNG